MKTKTTKPITCYGRITGRTFTQEWYETATRDAGRRARDLRKAGHKVAVQSMGTQVTSVGYVKMSLVTVAGQCEPPARVVAA